MHTQPLHRGKDAKEGQGDFLEEATSKLSGIRRKDPASLKEGRKEPRGEMEVRRGPGLAEVLRKRVKACPTLFAAQPALIT